jgi:hypothetical protein
MIIQCFITKYMFIIRLYNETNGTAKKKSALYF